MAVFAIITYIAPIKADIMIKKRKKPPIPVFCKCQTCENMFEVTGKKRSKFCSEGCRKKNERERAKLR